MDNFGLNNIGLNFLQSLNVLHIESVFYYDGARSETSDADLNQEIEIVLWPTSCYDGDKWPEAMRPCTSQCIIEGMLGSFPNSITNVFRLTIQTTSYQNKHDQSFHDRLAPC